VNPTRPEIIEFANTDSFKKGLYLTRKETKRMEAADHSMLGAGLAIDETNPLKNLVLYDDDELIKK
jgi:hypothetical protein